MSEPAPDRREVACIMKGMTMGKHLDRRTFLRGAGVAMALPALDATTRTARGAATPDDVINAGRYRMVMINTALGLHAP